MTAQTGTFITTDQLRLHTVAWQPAGPPRGLVFLVHGYGEHIGRYEPVAQALLHSGFAVYGLDHRGHGRSEGRRAYFARLDDAVNDLQGYFAQVSAQQPGLKRFMIGHSMGTLLALAFTLDCGGNRDLNGLILSGCAVNGDETVPAALRHVGRLLQSVVPTLPLLPGVPPAELSTDPAVVQAYAADPLVYHGWWRVGMGFGLLQAGQALRARAGAITLPLLILHGADDKITPVSGSHLLYERAASADKTRRMYAGMRHEIFNERDRAQPLADIQAWLTSH
ncbi:MAG: lysophospholipase [Anaerolineae bacterium]|nr:lysophospholipase [Anaerolineae bacterium]